MIFNTLACIGLQSASLSGIVLDGSKPVKDAVVWIESSVKPTPIHASVEQKNKKFVPRILIVPIGSTVDFPNRDDIFHNVFAEYNAKKFDLGMYPKGQTRRVQFDKVGTVSVLCNMHSDMSAFIIVVGTDHYTKTNAKGSFSFKNLPQGPWVLHAWHESGRKAQVSVTDPGPLRIVLGR